MAQAKTRSSTKQERPSAGAAGLVGGAVLGTRLA
jgi:hypothetical protein